MTDNQLFFRKIIKIICLTIGVAILFLPWQMMLSISYIAGAVLSLINVWMIAKKIDSSLEMSESRSRLNGLKSFYLRYLVLIVCSVILVKFAGINIVVYGAGLLSGQLVIIIVQAAESAGINNDQE